MQKYLLPVLAVASLIYACTNNNSDDATIAGSTDSISNSFCADTLHRSDLCAMLPYDINEKFQQGYTAILDPYIQPPFDVFSWQTFAYLNWPADANGRPLGDKIGGYPDTARVWESYTDLAELYGSDQTLLLHLNDAKKNNLKFFYMTSKSPFKLDSINGFQEADGNPLIDRNLNFAVYDVKVNSVESQFIQKYNLTTKAGIDSFGSKHNNMLDLPASDAGKKNEGSMEIKTSWRILDTSKGDIPSRYYTRNAIIFVAANNSTTGNAFTIKATVGLVGMHIIRKTGKFNKWIWSTFEQVDNTPDDLQQAQMNQHPKIPWSFYDPASMGLQPGIPPPFQPGDSGTYKFDPVAPYAARYAVSVFGEASNHAVYGSQAQRVYPIYYRTQQLNRLWQNKLKGTVWANYKLIGSQWTLGDPGIIKTPNVPSMLGNTTLETYMLNTASCIGCHGAASIVINKDTVKTDLSWMLALNAR